MLLGEVEGTPPPNLGVGSSKKNMFWKTLGQWESFTETKGGVCAQCAHIHFIERNWGFLGQSAIFLIIQTILHPHNPMFHPSPTPKPHGNAEG